MDQGSDPLAKWRGQQPQETPMDTKLFSQIAKSASIENPSGTPEEYEAFSITEGRPQERLIIRRLAGDTRAPAYRYLMDIAYNGEYGTEIVLYYSFMQVRIEGQNLTPVIKALLAGNCAFIQDYDAREYPKPLKEGDPLIKTIGVFMGTEAERARHEGREPEEDKVLDLDKARSETRGNGQDGGMGR